MAYTRLPGTSVELLDGNKVDVSSLVRPITLVIGRAHQGPVGVEVLLDDATSAAKVFGSNSPLLKSANKVKETGSVLLMRVAGKAAVLSGFAGEFATLETVEKSVVASSKFKVYVGQEPNDPAKNCLIVYYGSTNTIVYSNVTGAEVNKGLIKVSDFDQANALSIGTLAAPVVLSEVLRSKETLGNQAFTAAGGVKDFTMTVPSGNRISRITSVQVNGLTTTAYTMTGSVVNIPAVVDGDTVFVSCYFVAEDLFYTEGGNGLSSTLNEYYVEVDQALRSAEASIADFIYVEGAILDAENIADGSTATDKLTYLNIEEEDGEFIYAWSDSKVLYKLGAGTTTDSSLADTNLNGEPIVAKVYNEVNFAHRVAMHCYNVASNDGFVLGVVGTSVPDLTSVKAVSQFIGNKPTVDAETGIILANGTGLLGNKYMSGSLNRDKGFLLTDSGFPDGNTLTDSGGAPVDIGKFLSIVPQVVTFGGETGSGAERYLAVLASTSIGDSTTNRLIVNTTLALSVKKQKILELSDAGYVTFIAKSDGLHVTSGEIPTTDASDYQFVSTVLIVQNLVRLLRANTDRYIGKGITPYLVTALRATIDSTIRSEVGITITKGSFDLVQTGPVTIEVPVQITTAEELREIRFTLALTV